MIDLEIYVNDVRATEIISRKLYDICKEYSDIIFVFIGTDCNLGDSLAPLCGEMLKKRVKNTFFYGTLKNTITAKDVPYLSEYIKKAHPSSFVVAIDAALGGKTDVGKIKITDKGVKPGLGVNKLLPTIGNASIIGVVGEKTDSRNMTSVMRLGQVFAMARKISSAIEKYLDLKDDSKAIIL